MAAKLTLGKKSWDAPDSISDGDVADVLGDIASDLKDYASSGNSEPLKKDLDKLVKTAVPSDLKAAKDDKKAKTVLEDIRKTALEMTKAMGTIKTVEKGKPA
jgi:hypothetical protein